MRNSHKLIFASVALLLAALNPEIASFVPQWLKLGTAGILFLDGLYTLWKERQW